MISRELTDAAAGQSVLVSETGVEPLQLVGRAGTSSFLVGGKRGELASGPNPYELLSASLAACTATSIRFYADKNQLALTRLQVSVAFRRNKESDRDTFDRRIFVDGYLDDEQRAMLMQVANQCPVGRVLGKAAEMRTFVALSPDTWPANPPATDYMGDIPEEWLDSEIRPRPGSSFVP